MAAQEKDFVLDMFVGCIVQRLDVSGEFLPLRAIVQGLGLGLGHIFSIDQTEIRCCLGVVLVRLTLVWVWSDIGGPA